MHGPGPFQILTCGSGHIGKPVLHRFAQLGAQLPPRGLPHPGSPAFLQQVSDLLRSFSGPALVLLFPDALDGAKILEQYFLLEPGLLWFPVITHPSQAEALVRQLTRSSILGAELNTYAAEFATIFHGGMVLRMLLDSAGNIRRTNNRAREVLGYHVEPGQDFTALEDYPPGVLNDLLDRAKVLGTLSTQVDIRVFDRSLSFYSLVEFVETDKELEDEGYFLVEMEDVSQRLSREKWQHRRLEQEGTLATIGQRLISYFPSVPTILARTLEDLASMVQASRMTLGSLPIEAARVLDPLFQDPAVNFDFFPRIRPTKVSPWDEQLILTLCTQNPQGFSPVFFPNGDTGPQVRAAIPLTVATQVLGYVAVQAPRDCLEGDGGMGLCAGVRMVGQFLTRLKL